MPAHNSAPVRLVLQGVDHFPITIRPRALDFAVHYGAEHLTCNTYKGACAIIGAAVMHALAADGRVPFRMMPDDEEG